MEESTVSTEEPVSAENETEASPDTASHSRSSVDGAALAESDLLGFPMSSSSHQNSEEVVSQDGADDLLGFSTPQETLASSTELLDFASAPTSMSTSPEEDALTESHQTALLGLNASLSLVEEESAAAEQSQSSSTAAGQADLLDFMSSPGIILEESPREGSDEISINESKPVEESTVAETGAQSETFVDMASSEQTTESEPTNAAQDTSEKVKADAPATDAANKPVPLQLEALSDVSLGEAATKESSVTDIAGAKPNEGGSVAMEWTPQTHDPSEEPTSSTDTLLNALISEQATTESEGTCVDVKWTGKPQEGKSDELPPVLIAGGQVNGDAAALQTEASVDLATPTNQHNVNASPQVPVSESEQDAPAAVETPQAGPTEEQQRNSKTHEQETMKHVKLDVVDVDDIQMAQEDENEGMADVALDTVEVNSAPLIAASSEPPILSVSVANKVQQVDPWQMDNTVVNNQAASNALSPPVDGGRKVEPSSSTRIVNQSPTMVDIPVAGVQESNGDCAEQDALLVELQSSLQDHMTRQAEAEDRARKAEARVKELEQQLQAKEKAEADLETLKERMKTVVSDKAHLELELAKLRTIRDEHERKEIVLSNRLNAAKKKEALKADLAERLEEEVKELQSELAATKEKLAESEGSGQKAKKTLEETTKQMTERVRLAETALADERRLNEDRKKKMKAFIESKQEELRQGKLQNDELNAELEQTNRLLREQNSRWKQLHAQWVQSQTRNRELQRDLNRIKKDSDNMHKIGDKMEMKLSKSAQETEEHKNKRLTAKHELMTILRTLEGEREASSKLRDSLKFTFTPKAISQQQLLKESLKDLDTELEKLSRRLGRPLPPTIDSPALFSDDDETEASATVTGGIDAVSSEEGKDGSLNRSELDSNHLISNLENETQRVSQYIMALTSSIERMQIVLDESGPNTCINALTSILLGGGPPQIGNTSQEERSSMTRSNSRSTRYGQVPTS